MKINWVCCHEVESLSAFCPQYLLNLMLSPDQTNGQALVTVIYETTYCPTEAAIVTDRVQTSQGQITA